MTYAVKKDDFIVNMIVAHASQVEELGTALGAELINPKKYGLTIGDYWNGTAWTRNVDGEQVVLEPVGDMPDIEATIIETLIDQEIRIAELELMML